MKIVVQDANILIDLEMSGLLALWFQLDHETHTTDQVTSELRKGGHLEVLKYIELGVIEERTFIFEELERIQDLKEQCRSGPSFNDCSVLFLALELDANLLTGDRCLRKEANKRDVEVHGTLWIFDLLVKKRILLPQIAAEKLRALLEKSRFLPQKECGRRIERWTK